MTQNNPLPRNFRKLSIESRVKALKLKPEEESLLLCKQDLSELSDVLIESSVGTFPLPFGIAAGFLINGQEYSVPMVTEEPSVIAAACQGARLAASGGGFLCHSSDPILTTQLFFRDYLTETENRIIASEEKIKSMVNQLIPGIYARGGGFRGLEIESIKEERMLAVSIRLDVRDAMGANIGNTVAEGLKEFLTEISQGKCLMAILTNASDQRTAKATMKIPEKYLKKGDLAGSEVCQRIVLANRLACSYPKRAITHNKGIMNGVSALVLATGNDTRAVEAAVHFHAQKKGKYQAITDYRYEGGNLIGELELPMPVGSIGGAIQFWPPAQLALKILNQPTAAILSQIAAAVGLAQNLAALYALVTEGLQKGHMSLHAARIAYAVGARGDEVRALGAALWATKTLNDIAAKKLLEGIRNQKNDQSSS